MTPPPGTSANLTIWAGVAAGAGFGFLNLTASRWTNRKALALGERFAIPVMTGGFLARLTLLAVIVFAVPRSWMCAEAFVITFLVAFLGGLVLESRQLLNQGGGKKVTPPPPAEHRPQEQTNHGEANP
jgi:hypothetical protein